jgi:hypothetical protein
MAAIALITRLPLVPTPGEMRQDAIASQQTQLNPVASAVDVLQG